MKRAHVKPGDALTRLGRRSLGVLFHDKSSNLVESEDLTRVKITSFSRPVRQIHGGSIYIILYNVGKLHQLMS